MATQVAVTAGEATLDARAKWIAEIHVDRGSRRADAERRRERNRGVEHGVTGGNEMTREARLNGNVAVGSAEMK